MRILFALVTAAGLALGLVATDGPLSPTMNAAATEECAPNEFGAPPACVPYCTPRVSGMRVCYPSWLPPPP